MILLSIDTVADVVGVAVSSGANVLAVSEVRSERRHAEELTPMIDFVRRRADVDFREIDAVAVDVGPGLFTGMRVGIAAAKSIAHLLGVPTIGVCSLDALAADAAESTPESHDADPTSVIVATLDARRREVYWATYRTAVDGGDGQQRVVAPQVGSREDLLASVRERGQHVTFVGNWARDHADDLVSELAAVPLRASVMREHAGVPRVSTVARLAAAMALRERWCDPAQLQATYLRSPDVQISWETRPT
jgi:tRNA threonylcarbamoyladenosine biosynthesis protein TsaB